MKVAIVGYAGFNELDIFAPLYIINRVSRGQAEPALTAELTCARPTVRTMNGVLVSAAQPLSFVREADAVIIGGGGTLNALADEAFMSELRLDPTRQLIASQCSGALALARLGWLRNTPACVDTRYR